MWTLSGFSDEISQDFAEQLATVKRLGLSHIEFRSAWGSNVLDLTDAQLDEAKALLAAEGLAVSSIGSPIGKIDITADNAPHLDRMRHCAEVAQHFDARFVRMFSYFIPEGHNPDDYRDEVLRRIDALAAIGADAGLTLIHENEKEIYGDIPRRCLDIVTSIDNPALKLTWDNANFVQCGVRPYSEAYELLRPHVVYLQVKDAVMATGEVVPSGEGDGESRETWRAFAASGFEGFASLEPHLAGHRMGGWSGEEFWTQALHAFTGILDEEGIAYR